MMLLEAVDRSILYRWPKGEIRLRPGVPVDLPIDRARRLLAKAPGKVRIVPEGACWTCGGAKWWLSIHDKLICAICHPPANPALVADWLPS